MREGRRVRRFRRCRTPAHGRAWGVITRHRGLHADQWPGVARETRFTCGHACPPARAWPTALTFDLLTGAPAVLRSGAAQQIPGLSSGGSHPEAACYEVQVF